MSEIRKTGSEDECFASYAAGDHADRHDRPVRVGQCPCGAMTVNASLCLPCQTKKGRFGGYRSGVTKRLRTTTLVESGR